MSKIRNKLLLVMLLLTLVPALLISAWSVFTTSKVLRDNVLIAQQHKVSLIQERINNFVANVPGDLFFLRDSNALDLYLAAQQEERGKSTERLLLKNLRDAFRVFSEQKKIYTQVRYLDSGGMEIVRINRKDEVSKTISDTHLQSKAGRYYFDEAATMEQGELHISRFNLNREKGDIDADKKPVLRYSTPVFDNDGELQGVVVLNVDGSLLLDIVKRENVAEEQLIFTSNEGHYYFHGDPEKTWGGPEDLDTGINIFEDNPAVAEKLKVANPLEYLESDQGILIFNPVSVNDGQRELGLLFSIVPREVLYQPLQNYFMIFGGIVLASLIATWLLASMLSKSLTRPLVELKDSVERFSKGDIETPIETNAKNEIGELSRAIELLRKSMSILMTRSR